MNIETNEILGISLQGLHKDPSYSYIVNSIKKNRWKSPSKPSQSNNYLSRGSDYPAISAKIAYLAIR